MRQVWQSLGWLFCAGVLASAGCRLPWTNYLVLPARNTVVRDQLVVHSDFPLPANHRLIEELAARRRDLQEGLGLPASDEPIHVYLFEDSADFRRFVSLYHPDFPARRAFFLETDTRLQVYGHWGDRVAEDLRHEVMHGYLHSVMSNLPLWLDEGLAEYAEAPRDSHGLNHENLNLLRQRRSQGWQPSLARLESFKPTRDMNQEEYAESWAWVQFLLETGPEHRAILRGYLEDLRRDGRAAPLSARLAQQISSPDHTLLAHLNDLTNEGDRPQAAAKPLEPE